jgi:parallel beta-helix repeat protein
MDLYYFIFDQKQLKKEAKMKKHIIFLALFCAMIFIFSGSVSATSINATPLPNYSNIYVKVANDEGVSFNTTGNNTYYIQQLGAPNGGFNAVHIANDSSYTLNYGGPTNTTNQSGTFYATDTGGRGYQDDGVLMLAVNGTIPDNFAVQITAKGYNWTPTGALNAPPSSSAINPWGVTLNETFTKSDFIYGLQNWKPTGGNANYPLFIGEDMNNTNNMFYIMFIDLHAGFLGSNYPGGDSQFINNGAIEIDYNFLNLQTFAAFNIYAWNWNTTQGQGMLWTNSILPGNTGGPSGYTVTGTPKPNAAFTANSTNPLINQSVQFTDQSIGATPLTYSWNFGDGSTSTLQNPTHTYTSAGNYTVTETVTNSFGSSQAIQNIIASSMDVSASVPGGLYNASLSVNLNSTDSQATIYYTLDGSNPSTNSTHYTAPISITNEGTTILKYMAVDGGLSSIIKTEVYTLDKTPPTVTANPIGGTYNTVQNVTLTTTDASNTTTYYTNDTSDPKSSSTRTIYSKPIPIYNNTILKYAALDAAGNWSPVYTQNYTMVSTIPPVASVSLPSGNYTTDQNVYLNAVDVLDPNPKIYYTLNGTDPTVNSTLYHNPIQVNVVGTTVLKFIAVNYAGLASNIITDIYNLDKLPVSGTWNSTSVDTSNIEYDSIAIDSSGYVHIAYFQNSVSGSNPQLKYAYQDASGWHIETVESSPAGSGYYVALALDSAGNPHLAYMDFFGGAVPYTLRYAYKNSTGWHISTLTTSYAGNTRGDIFEGINLVLYQDQPRISCYNDTSGIIVYMYQNGTNWTVENVSVNQNGDPNGGPYDSLVIDSSGNPKISYYSISPQSGYGSLRYAYRTVDGVWHSQIVDNLAEDVGEYNSLALDSAGNPCISYIWNDNNLNYAYWNGTQWLTETVSNLTSAGCKLALDQSNSPLIVYQDAISYNLKYAYKVGSNWTTSNIDSINGANDEISLVLNSLGVPNVSYETENYNLRYAYLMPFNVNDSLAGGTYNLTQTVNLTATPGTTIYYTMDSSDPRTSSTKVKYTAPISIKNTTTLKFAAEDSATNWSSIYTETYVIVKPVTNNRTGIIYNTIQAAIDDQNTTNGDTLIVNPGTFTENVIVDKRLILNALGAIVNPLNNGLPVFTITSSGDGSTINGFTINGGFPGISLNSASNCNITNNTISNNIYGVLMEYGSSNTISGNQIVNNTNAGIASWYWNNNNNITNNTIKQNGYGLHLLYSSNNNISNNSLVNNSFYGIYADNSQNNVLNNNTIQGNPYAGVALYFTANNNTFTGNNLTGNGFGIYSYGSNGNTIQNSNLSNNTYYGVYLDNSAQNVIKNDTINGNPYTGIALYRGSNTNTIKNNTFTGNGFGIYIDGSNGGSSDPAGDISGNNITGNLFYGIYMYNSSNMKIMNNTVKNNPYAGIAIYGGSSNNTLSYNTLQNNQFGLYMDSSSNNSVYKNDFVSNTVQAYDNGTNNWDNGTTGNYWSDWTTTSSRAINGGSNVDHHPSLTQF